LRLSLFIVFALEPCDLAPFSFLCVLPRVLLI
jgi:hypothetical protein